MWVWRDHGPTGSHQRPKDVHPPGFIKALIVQVPRDQHGHHRASNQGNDRQIFVRGHGSLPTQWTNSSVSILTGRLPERLCSLSTSFCTIGAAMRALVPAGLAEMASANSRAGAAEFPGPGSGAPIGCPTCLSNRLPWRVVSAAASGYEPTADRHPNAGLGRPATLRGVLAAGGGPSNRCRRRPCR